MELYIETSINLIVRLSREAHEPNTSFKRYMSLANAISNVLNSIDIEMCELILQKLKAWH